MLPTIFKALMIVMVVPLMGGHVFAAEVKCSINVPYPLIDVKITLGEARYLNNKTKNDLKRFYRKDSASQKGWSPIGLTRAEFHVGVGVTAQTEQISYSQFCTELKSVEASLGYDIIDVYIARKYKRGSCQYTSILDHERRHVGIFQDTLNAYAPRIETRLRQIAKQMGPVPSSDPKKALTFLQKKLEDAVIPIIEAMISIRNQKNAAIDTKENYLYEQENCLSW